MYNLRQAAEKIGIKTRTLRQWVRQGKIKAEKNPISLRLFFSEDEVNQIAEVYKK